MKKLTYLFLLASVSFLSCEKEGIEGPNLNDLFGELNIIEEFQIVNDSASFNTESVILQLSFPRLLIGKFQLQALVLGRKR